MNSSISAKIVAIAAILCLQLALSCKKKEQPSQKPPVKTFKVLSYNVYEGFRGDEQIIKDFKKWADTLNADVIAFQEMKYFTKASLKSFAEELGYPHSVMFFETGLPLALISKHPIKNASAGPTGLHLIQAEILGHHFFVTHLSSLTYTLRQQQFATILDRIKLIDPKEKILMMGDFNNMSPQDAADYDNDAKMNLLIQSERNNPEIKILNNGKIDYTVIRTVLDNGFYDSWKLFSGTFEKSAPTKLRSHNNYTRIDYIFINKPVLDNYQKAYFVKDRFTDYASDHYPMVFVCKRP